MPTVSIIIPTYNRADDLRRALASVRAQTYADFECIVVDNHSTDDTEAVVAGYGDARLRLVRIHNRGVVAASRNAGIRAATGEYIAFLDSDDWWAVRKLEVSLRHLQNGCDFVYHDMYLAPAPALRFWARKSATRPLASPVFEDLLAQGNAINLSSVVVRRRVIEASGGFAEDAELVGTEDYDAWLKVARVTERMQRIPATLGHYFVGGGNLSNPARTVANLEALEQRYATELAGLARRPTACWIAYTKARANFRLHRYDAAREILAGIGWPRLERGYFLRRMALALLLRVAPASATGRN